MTRRYLVKCQFRGALAKATGTNRSEGNLYIRLLIPFDTTIQLLAEGQGPPEEPLGPCHDYKLYITKQNQHIHFQYGFPATSNFQGFRVARHMVPLTGVAYE